LVHQHAREPRDEEGHQANDPRIKKDSRKYIFIVGGSGFHTKSWGKRIPIDQNMTTQQRGKGEKGEPKANPSPKRVAQAT